MAKSVRLRALRRGERRVLQAKVGDRRLSVRLHHRYRVIAEVASGRSMADAADRVGCAVTMAYEWVHRFNESGFTTFERASNPQDRRSYGVALTQSGVHLARELRAASEQLERDFFASLSQSEQESLHVLLLKLYRGSEGMDDGKSTE